MIRDASRAQLAAIAATLASVSGAHALPINPQTVASSGGAPNITTGSTTVTVDQTSERVIIDWESFAIAAGEAVTFNMPGGTAIAVNRVPFCGACSVQAVTTIDGAINSNGNVWILDARGVFFGAGAQVDVHGLLASTANLVSDTAFVGAAPGDPVSFQGALLPSAVVVDPGAQVAVRGGPAIFISEAVRVGGSVTGLSPTSQVLLGATHSFSLRFGATPPDPMSNSDLQLFDFVIEGGPPRSPMPASGSPFDAIATGPMADISAGTVMLAGSAPPPDPVLPGDPVQFRIGGHMESTAGPVVINGAGGIVGGAPDGALSAAEIDVVIERVVFGFLDQMNQPQAFVAPVTELRSASGYFIAGRNVSAPQVTDLGSEFNFLAPPDHVTATIDSSGASPGVITARNDIKLQNVATAAGLNLISGGDVVVRNSLGGFVAYGDVSAMGDVFVQEINAPDGTPGSQAVAFTLSDVTSTSGAVRIDTRGAVNTGVLTASFMRVVGGDDVGVGGANGASLVIDTTGNVQITGPVMLVTGALVGVPALQVIAGQNVMFGSAVTSVRDIFVRAGGLFSTADAMRVTGASGPGLTVGAMPVFSGVDVRAADISLGATLDVQGAAGAGANLLTSSAAAVGDGVSAPFSLSNDEVQRITAPLLAVRVLPPLGAGTLTVGALTLDAARVGETVFAVGGGGALRVPGTVTGVGAPGLRFGDGVQAPGRIEVSGALGVAGSALGRTTLAATGDILIGTQAFIELANGVGPSSLDPGALAPTFGGATDGQFFLVAGETTFSGGGAILSQKTGSGGLSFAIPTIGSAFGAPSATTRIDIFGRVRARNGDIVTGFDAARVAGLLDAGVTASDRLSINNCQFGVLCMASSSVDPVSLFGVTNQFRNGPPPLPGVGADAGAGGQPPGGGPARQAARAASAIEVEDEASDYSAPENTRETRDPGVGSANEDLWPSMR